jgi:hypothetical protein
MCYTLLKSSATFRLEQRNETGSSVSNVAETGNLLGSAAHSVDTGNKATAALSSTLDSMSNAYGRSSQSVGRPPGRAREAVWERVTCMKTYFKRNMEKHISGPLLCYGMLVVIQ